jgi:hypothetical protein
MLPKELISAVAGHCHACHLPSCSAQDRRTDESNRNAKLKGTGGAPDLTEGREGGQPARGPLLPKT